MSRFIICLGVVLVFSRGLTAEEVALNFSRDIRPILSDKCFQCHGPDQSAEKSGLRLDLREMALGKADSGSSAIVPMQPEASELVKRITSKQTDYAMPPRDSPKQLSEGEVALLRKWIAQGANYEGHWAFDAPKRPELPNDEVVLAKEWRDNPVDRLVYSGLRRVGLTPQESASKETLVRRVSLDLTGLPPTPNQIDAYLTDPSPNAYERMVDRFFASPHYGERMALNWMDYARYADSNGYQSDGSRDIWGWRDWVIHAYNQNKPFDQFTIEQLAGDMLPNATQDQIIATGFNRNHRLNGEGGRIVEEWFVETVIDRVETTGLTWLGLTFNCCRCHDHKYDPIKQREFYQMFAFFNSVEEVGVLAPAGKNGENTPPLLTMKTAAHQSEIARRETEIAAFESTHNDLKSQLPNLATRWAERMRAERDKAETLKPDQAIVEPVEPKASENQSSGPADGDANATAIAWQQLAPIDVKSTGGATLTRLEDGSYLASGTNPANDTYVVTLPFSEPSITGVLLEVMPDASLPNQSLGRGFNGNFVLTDIAVELVDGPLKRSRPMNIARAQADFAQAGWPVDNVLANMPKSKSPLKGWAIDGNNPKSRLHRKAMFVADKAQRVPKGANVRVTLSHRSEYADHNIGRFRLSLTSVAPEQITLGASGIPANVLATIHSSPDQWSDSDRKALEDYYLTSAANPLRESESKLASLRKALKEYIDDIPTTMVMKEAAPREASILIRGEYDKPAAKVQRGIPSVLPQLPKGSTVDRLGLAQWIVSRDNPLTARVWVNREWERFFGMGIVKTTENLGSQAEYPVNPKLLDWLAVEFMEPTILPAVGGQSARPWDMKALQKLMVMSSAYRQSSQVTPEILQQDPDNRLASRGPRFRLPGEIVRDSSLAVSGTLVDVIGGPSVRPYMPAGVWDETSKYGNLRNYQHDKNDGLYRRSMYTIWKRTAAPPTMLLFDAPNREVCTVKRSRTNTPLQALSLLNEVTFVEAARKLAGRMLKEGGETTQQRLAYGFRLALARYPTDSEMKVLVRGLDTDKQQFAKNPSDAKQLVTFGESKASIEAADEELAAYTLAANVSLNLDEFVTRE
ncbi:MAG: PSD1 and planctomycete cytochrome C domain-containing protein [Pirellula sp.]